EVLPHALARAERRPAAERVREGGSFSAALSATGAFPPMMVHMVTSGEAGRDVPGMMNRAADFLDTEFETGSAALLAVAEPLIIVLMGGIVGLIVLSIMLPILQLNTLAMS
ncbi:MAG: type II secretion system protein GspF, partial [Hyphomonas sp.]|nr:type II secretion system protein GspF [Hyphomonas sp.]